MKEGGREWARRAILWSATGVLAFCIVSAAFRNYGWGDGFFFVPRWPFIVLAGVALPLILVRVLLWKGAPSKRSRRRPPRP